MALTKEQYEEAIGRPLSEHEYANLTNITALDAAGTSRAAPLPGGRDVPQAESLKAQVFAAEKKELAGDMEWRAKMEEERRDANDKASKKAAAVPGQLVKKTASSGTPMKEAAKSVPYKSAWNQVDPTDGPVLKSGADASPFLPAAPAPTPLNDAASTGTPMSVAGKAVPYKKGWNAVNPADGPVLESVSSTSPFLPASPQPTPLNALASTGTPMATAAGGVPYKPGWSQVNPADGPMLASVSGTNPALPGAPAPVAAPAYAFGMAPAPAPAGAPPAGLIALNEDLKKKAKK